MKFIIILICKLLKFAGGLLGRGSNLPGKVALKLDPNILKKIKMPQCVLAVTGSNGKTTTVELIAHILRQNGKKVAYNKESNLTAGVATFVLADCTLRGRMRSEILLLETDELYAQHTFEHIMPTHYAVTNLFSDQPLRNGHTQWVYERIKKSINENMTLILNADDPLVTCLGEGHEKVVWFGISSLSEAALCSEFANELQGQAFCPNCSHQMDVDFIASSDDEEAQTNWYSCPNCAFAKPATDYTAEYSDAFDYFTLNKDYTFSVTLPSAGNVRNILAACAVTNLLGISISDIRESVNGFTSKTGRVCKFTLGNNSGVLLVSKHENSGSYTQSVKTAVALAQRDAQTVVIIVDKLSRKYSTNDVSWLWNIDFSFLADKNIKNVILTGNYCNDLAFRFAFTQVPQNRIKVIASVQECAAYLKEESIGEICVITCFTDKDNFLKTCLLQ